MSEIPHNPEIDAPFVARNSVLIAYAASALMNASSEGFADDLHTGIHMVNTGTLWYDKRPITEADRLALASSSVLNQIAQAISADRPLVFSPDVEGQLAVYLYAQEIMDTCGIRFEAENIDTNRMLAAVRAMKNNDTVTDADLLAVGGVWAARGTKVVAMESSEALLKKLDELSTQETAPDYYIHDENNRKHGYEPGVEAWNLPATPSWNEELPYYRAFFDEFQGAEWLNSLLEDLLRLHRMMAE